MIAADARSETEWGTLRSYVEFEANSDTSVDGDGSGDESIEMVAGFVQFAGITAGKAGSFYDFVEYDSIGDFFSSEDVWTLAYTASFGSGFAATIAIEDKSYRELNSNLPDVDQVWPNVVAALRVDQAWGAAQVSGAIQDNEGDRDEYLGGFAGDDIGWAVQAGIKLNVPFVGMEGTYVWAQGAYSEGAISYAGAEDVTGNFVNVTLGFIDDQAFVGGEFVNNEMWQVGGGVGVQASEKVRLNLMGTYFEYDTEGLPETIEAFSVEGNVFWTPVDNLDLGLAAVYSEADFGGGFEVDTWGLVGRIERGF